MKKGQVVIIGIGLLLAIVSAFLIAVYGFGFLQRETADFRGETGQIEETKANSSYRIASYNKFYDKCASIQSLESKINNMQDELDETKAESQRETVLNTSITASKNKRSELIASYNADARKEDTEGQFRASDLPYKIDENEEETICEAY